LAIHVGRQRIKRGPSNQALVNPAAEMTWVAEALTILRSRGVALDSGLDEKELVAAEAAYGLELSPDYRELLAVALPLGGRPNWRDLDSPTIRWKIRR
jgi:hypothetical protein